MSHQDQNQARKWIVHGRVQGVGFRYFVHGAATTLGINGTVRNTEDGCVEVIAVGSKAQLEKLTAELHRGPRMSQVTHVEEHVVPVQQYGAFQIER